MKRVTIIFSGFNQRAIIAFMRTLKKNRLNYVIVARDNNDDIFNTSYKEKVFFTRENLDIDKKLFKKINNKLSVNYPDHDFLIAPTTEGLNRFLVENVSFLFNLRMIVPLVNSNLYESISDKSTFGKICLNYNIALPQELSFFSRSTIPFVAKPKHFKSNQGNVHTPKLILNEKDYDDFVDNYNREDFYYQEYLNGESFYLLYYISKDGNVYKTSQINYLQQPEGKSIIAAISSNLHLKKENLIYEKMLKDLNFHGLIMIEIMKTPKGQFLIEANPRFWGPSQLFIDANYNLFEAFMFDYGLIDEPNLKASILGVNYFWFGGVNQSMMNKGYIKYHELKEKDFLLELENWIKNEVYRRDDTIEIFKDELKWIKKKK